MKEGTWVVCINTKEIFVIVYKTGSGYRATGLSGIYKNKSVYFRTFEVVPFWIQKDDKLNIRRENGNFFKYHIVRFEDYMFYPDYSVYEEAGINENFENFLIK